MKPTDIQIIGNEMAIKWENGDESFLSLAKLRKACPCAGCKGEMDVMGNTYKGPERQYKLTSFRIRSIKYVGVYAIQPTWEDDHSTGLYAYDYLRAVADSPGKE
jgi:DUF971 family protein